MGKVLQVENIVTTTWVHDELKQTKKDYAIIDVRFNLADPTAGEKAFAKGHMPGAVYVDLEKDLSSAQTKHGGRHPLPDFKELAEKLGSIGIGNDTNVIVYDDQGGMFASRFWWLLNRLGHSKVAVLDGGFSKWVSDGYEVTDSIEKKTPKPFALKENGDWALLEASDVKEKLNDPNTIIIDSREPNRYLGLEEPIDPIAGHIPGAVNYFWKNVLNEDGLWKDSDEVKRHFADVDRSKEVIVYCGSGVSACPNILALKRAGYSDVRLYAGSWSDWITHKDYPVEGKKQ
ncbi:sulfurtransferase [bacterium LRH843]|nr:sulfurtransferase [bacterium LRH843]